jgi:hypothetical protein
MGSGVRASARRAERAERTERTEHPEVIVCAWCESNGSPHGAARHPSSPDWWAVSHEFVREAARAGRASHGICPLCRPIVVEGWGLA